MNTTALEGEVIPDTTALAVLNPPLTTITQANSTSPADTNPARVYLASLSETGRRSAKQKLNRIAKLYSNNALDIDTFQWHLLRYQDIQAIRTLLVEQAGLKRSTANTCLTNLRTVLKNAVRLGQMSNDDFQNATDIKAYKSDTLPRGRALNPGEISALMIAATRTLDNACARNAALVAVLYGAGLRRSELVNLDLKDYDPETGALTVRAGKGNKDRVTYLGTTAPVEDWIVVRGNVQGPLFTHINKSDRIILRRLGVSSVTYILQELAKLAVVETFSPHDLRRSFISDLLDAGADISTAQKLAGHANVTTTSKYDRRGEVTKKKAAGLLHVPYNRPKRVKLTEPEPEE